MAFVALHGGERTLAEGETILARANPDRVIAVTVHLKPETDRMETFVRSMVDNRPSGRRHLSRQEYASSHGASVSDFQKVKRFTRQFGLRVVRDGLAARSSSGSVGHRTAELRGTIRAFSRAFGVDLVRVRDAKGNSYRTYVGSLNVPDTFQDVIGN